MNKKISKKKKVSVGVLSFFMIAIATAGLLQYYGSIQQEISVTSPIEVQGLTPDSVDALSGEEIEGETITVINDAPFAVMTTITNDAPEGIDVEYQGTTELSKKEVVFGESEWATLGDPITVEYTVVGDSFNAEVTEPITGYELVYYKDNSDRFNNPATAISITEISENLPYEEDGNADEYDMCEIENYTNCHGAKIWYVPSDAIDGEGNVDWARADEFYFETNLIQYNANGEISVYDTLEINPIYSVDPLFEGTATVTTTIN